MMLLTRQNVFSIALVSLFVLAIMPACQRSTNPNPRPGRIDPIASPYNDPNISIIDPTLQEWLVFQTPVMVRTGTSPMSVEVPVRNTADDQYLIDYRFVFYDHEDREIEPVMAWRFKPLYPKQVERLKATALSDRAVNWKLQVKWSDQ